MVTTVTSRPKISLERDSENCAMQRRNGSLALSVGSPVRRNDAGEWNKVMTVGGVRSRTLGARGYLLAKYVARIQMKIDGFVTRSDQAP